MALFTPIWMTDNIKKSAKAIEYVKNKVDDDEELLQVIKQARLDDVKAAAAKKLSTDTARLRAIVNCKGIFVQDAALRDLSDKSLIDKNIYFAIIDPTTREKVIDELSDETLLNEIIHRDSSPRCRLLALEKTSNESIALSALMDKDADIRAEAVYHIHDNDTLVAYLANNGKTLYKRRDELKARIDTFTKEQLEKLLDGNFNDVVGDIKRYACGRLGHQLGKNCRCERCGSIMDHSFDENGLCKNCGARQITERETLYIMGEPYGYRDDLVIVYPDGKKEPVKKGQEVITASDDKMKWLLSDY